jgi:GDPmannose 4,6-dehydratase
MKKRALITGITGQDGAYLAKLLLEKGYDVFGIFRRLSTPNFWRLQYFDIIDKITFIPAELNDSSSLKEAIEISNPDECYNLAAQSFVGASFEEPISTGNVTGLGATRLLESIRDFNKDIKFYQASSSELYGKNSGVPQNEQSTFQPQSPYAVAKLYSYWITKVYRDGYNIFASNGILFNHESPIRGLDFVTRKITNSIAKISLGLESEIALGNIDARRDWGYAPEYVEAMWQMLQLDKPDDFVIATGETHSVREFLEIGFSHLNLNWEDHTKIDKRFLRPLDVNILKGDFSKFNKETGWVPKTKFAELVKLMLDVDIKRWRDWINGERFVWDALLYPNNLKISTRGLKV